MTKYEDREKREILKEMYIQRDKDRGRGERYIEMTEGQGKLEKWTTEEKLTILIKIQ